MKTKRVSSSVFFVLLALFYFAGDGNAQVRFSTAGFHVLSDSPRQVFDMNPGWRFCKGRAEGAERVDFNDSEWQVVSLPNGLETLPLEASGSINYRGEAWYRKHFTLPSGLQGERCVLYFEGIMGKSKIWVNGTLVGEHFGGYLPVSLDITEQCRFGEKNLVSVWADNSDDPNYPPGKPQTMLDFCYFGGIYRDCWLYTTSRTYITDANMRNANKTGNGGVAVYYEHVSDNSADVCIQVNLQSDAVSPVRGEVEFVLRNDSGEEVAKSRENCRLKGNTTLKKRMTLSSPVLWSPDTPYLYTLEVRVKDGKGNMLDGYGIRTGIRTIGFDPKRGLILNGKVFSRKLIGANRHQDYALIGNALSNSLHWRDAKKLKDAGMDIIRNAHYPQDPAFMEACDALGLFVIVNTPGWQFWSDEPVFRERIYSDIRNMVRRDRNHPCVIMWEPILNETNYPDYFAKEVHGIVKEEALPGNNYTAADLRATGSQYFDISFTAPLSETDPGYDENKIYFTREWGDNVDDWNAHNSPSRVARQWGEHAQLIQARDYGRSPVGWASIDVLYETKPNHLGGCLWHSFDHQRGYHPDPFYGGIMDAFRRPKYSYYMFQAKSHQTRPMVYVANLMTPFSPEDVTVYSNCDEVRLTTQTGEKQRVYRVPQELGNKPFPIVRFEKAFDFMVDKKFARGGKHSESYLLAEGLIDGKVVASHKVCPARQSTEIRLSADTENMQPVANGGDLVTVVAQVTDCNGVVKRLNNTSIVFEIEGEGRLIGADKAVPVLWGEACVLVQTTSKAGKVRIKARMEYAGEVKPSAGELEFATLPSPVPQLFDADEEKQTTVALPTQGSGALSEEQKQELMKASKIVEAQQEQFGEKDGKR